MQRIKMLLPVPLPEAALKGFAAQLPPSMVRDGLEVDFGGIRAGTTTLDSLFEAVVADAMVMDAGIAAANEGYDAICVNSMSDSGVAGLRSILDIPVVGPGESSFHVAAMLGKRFSIITMWERWLWIYEKLGQQTGLQSRIASVRHIDTRPDTQELLAGKEEIVFAKLEEQCRRAVEEDGADVLILGSTTMHQSHAFLSERLNVPILNPGVIAFKICEMLLDLKLAQSKKAYPSPERPTADVFTAIASQF